MTSHVTHIFTNIAQIFDVATDSPAWLAVSSDGLIADMGPMPTFSQPDADVEVTDVGGGMIIPAYCDSHTHIVWAGSRHAEFVDKINGLSYEEIARRGGGIINSALRLRKTPENALFEQSLQRAVEMMHNGTGAMEVKSGYGLCVSDELKMLRVAARIADSLPVAVRTTFLGAHAVPPEYKGDTDGYVRHIVDEMLPAVAAEGLAQYVDVFCDRGFFTPAHTSAILEAAAQYGMRPKIHADELAQSGGTEVGIAHRAVSVDHLECAGTEQLRLLSASSTVATMLPGASFFLGMPYAPARQALAMGCDVALASDYNPGSSPSGDMRFVWALGCIKMRLAPDVALRCCTAAGARAMGLDGMYGVLRKDAAASFIVTRPLDNLAEIPYRYTSPYIARIYMQGRRI